MDIDYTEISRKLEDIIKARIKDLGLVDTGKLLNSITASFNSSGTISITAEDYYDVLDKKHNITNYATSSKVFTDFTEKEINKQVEKYLTKQLKLK
jgi:hypothetical protein